MITASATAVANKPGLRPDPPIKVDTPTTSESRHRVKLPKSRNSTPSEGVNELLNKARDAFDRVTTKQRPKAGPAQVRVAPGLLEGGRTGKGTSPISNAARRHMQQHLQQVQQLIDKNPQLTDNIRQVSPGQRTFQTGPMQIDPSRVSELLRAKLDAARSGE